MTVSNNTVIKTALSNYQNGYSLDQIFYANSDIYQHELDKIFMQNWLFAGHTSQIPNIGDFFTLDIANESVIIVKTSDCEIKAHMNVCRHRGSRLCLEKSGSKKLFTCPYHAWGYDLEGKLVAARFMADDFDADRHSLHTVHLECVGGLIFVSLAVKPLSISDMRENLDDIFDLFGFNHLKLAAKKSYNIAANWKLAVENYQECYHCAPSHKEFAAIHAMSRPPEEFEALKASFKDETKRSHSEYNYYFDCAKEGQEGYQYGRNPLLPGNVTGSRKGKPVAPLLGNIKQYDGGASEFMLGPVNFFLLYDDHIVGYRFAPVTIDSCVCEIFWFVHEDAVEGHDYDVEALTWLWDVTTQADKEIIMNNQLGVNSRFYKPGRLSEMESFEQSFIDWYLSALAS